MNIEFVARNFTLHDDVRQFTADKLRKATKFLEEPLEVRVTLEVEKHRHMADLHIAHRYGVVQANEETPEMKDAINLAVDKVEKQARRSRKRHVDSRRRADRARQADEHWPIAVVASDSLRGGSPRVIESIRIDIKPMTIEEAALELEDSQHGFVVFRDAGNDRVSVLYRRRDSNYGLIAPEF
jgi:putative sigma-54 modulation protein